MTRKMALPVDPTDGTLDDDRIVPLLLAQAATRDASHWDYQDVHQVIAALLAKLDAARDEGASA